MWQCLVFFSCALVAAVAQGNTWVVDIAQGRLRGHIDPDGGVYNFLSIPYAIVPTGRDRFKAPLAPPVWMYIFDAIGRNISCLQAMALPNPQEDCLLANVYVPDTREKNLPVLVVVHGGDYQFGASHTERFNDLVRTKKLIVVTFNYRLGVHGFLCLGTEGAPGNAGIKDQIALLRWVNANIAGFGGNPEDVTLAGCSAGSGSVDVLTLSSLTTGLIKKAIMESGNSLGGVGVTIDPIENAKNYARILGFEDVDNMTNLEEFYTGAIFEKLVSRNDLLTSTKNSTILFGPCVEQDIGQERAIKEAPMNVVKRGNYTKVPMLYGFTNMEGAMRLLNIHSWSNQMNEKFSDFLPGELRFESDNVKEEVAQTVKRFYFGDQPVCTDNILPYILYFTDVLFGYPMLRSLTDRVESLGDTIYLYEYSFVDSDTEDFFGSDVRGAQHCAQINAVMDQDVSDRTEEFRQMQTILRDYWLSFIINGTPSSNSSALPLPTWLPANVRRVPHMSLGPVIELKSNILEGRAALWDSIYEKHYGGPVVHETTGGASSIVITNVMFAAVLTSFYFSF